MTKEIRLRKAEGTWTVRTTDAVLGETRNAIELDEPGHDLVIYFPRADLAMALMDRSATTSTCPWKGEASYFSISTGSGTIVDAAWSYETPIAGMERIAGHLAFYPDKVTIEQL